MYWPRTIHVALAVLNESIRARVASEEKLHKNGAWGAVFIRAMMQNQPPKAASAAFASTTVTAFEVVCGEA